MKSAVSSPARPTDGAMLGPAALCSGRGRVAWSPAGETGPEGEPSAATTPPSWSLVLHHRLAVRALACPHGGRIRAVVGDLPQVMTRGWHGDSSAGMTALQRRWVPGTQAPNGREGKSFSVSAVVTRLYYEASGTARTQSMKGTQDAEGNAGQSSPLAPPLPLRAQ